MSVTILTACVRYYKLYSGTSDVNKDWTHKDQDKDKDQSHKDKDND